jgi:Ni/Fe-hydrogenase 1 B-type cytochrome subunit
MNGTIANPTQPSLFRTSYSASIRIWHWLVGLLFVASITMVLLASTVFTMSGNTPMVQEQVQQKGGTVTPQQAKAVAHEYSDKLWMLHKYIGFGLCFLLLCRMFIEAGHSTEKRLGTKIKNALRLQVAGGWAAQDRKHYLWVKWGYVFFYLCFLLMALSGLGLAFEDLPFLRNNHDIFEGTHSFVQWLVYAYILAHIAGVIRSDMTDNKGLVSRMINGGKD